MSRLITRSDSLITPPEGLALDLEWAKKHIRTLTSYEDELIEVYIQAAAQYFEEITGRQLLTATWEHYLDGAPMGCKIELPHPPLQAVASVEYLSGDDYVNFSDGGSPEVLLWQSFAPAGPHAARGWVEVTSGAFWPTVLPSTQAIKIRYTAGYGDTAADLPDLVKAALALLTAHFEQFRSEVHLSDRSTKVEELPFGAKQIMRGFMGTALPTLVARAWA